jgi:hypothetical protein
LYIREEGKRSASDAQTSQIDSAEASKWPQLESGDRGNPNCFPIIDPSGSKRAINQGNIWVCTMQSVLLSDTVSGDQVAKRCRELVDLEFSKSNASRPSSVIT